MTGLAPPTPLPDAAARRTALTDLGHGLLVEAGAGSGKTAVLAGRVAWLLAGGVEPRHVAAITFTEFAAAELASRVRDYVTSLAAGVVPAPLEPAFGAAPTVEQRRHLAAALPALDELTSTTIHGFARELTLPYPVEAGIDPGATVLDAAEAELLFGDVFGAWLRRRLGGRARDDATDPLVHLMSHPAAPGPDAVKELALLLRAHPGAAPPAADVTGAVRGALAAAAALRGLIGDEPAAPEPLVALAAAVDAWLAPIAAAPSTTEAATAALSGEPGPLFTQQLTVRALRSKGAWLEAVAAAGASKAAAAAGYAALQEAHGAFAAAAAALTAASVDHLLGLLVAALREMLAEYGAAKRERAAVDFDDLIANAAALLREHEVVRAELAARYRHVLVDEFQDTDPSQAEIVWRLTGEPRPGDWRAWPARPAARFVVGDPNQSIYRFRGADPGTYAALRGGLERDPGSLTLALTENFRSVPALLANANLTFAAPLSASGQAGYANLGARRPDGRGAALVRLQVGAAAEPAAAGGDGPHAAAERYMEEKRAAEARAVASLCRRLVDGATDLLDGPVSPGDIALLAPTSTGLEHHERALEALGLDVASQAGKGFYRRQEVQDMVALTCALADPANTLALGAFLHGPMVGVTLEELLDVAHALAAAGAEPQLSLRTDPALVPVPRVAEVIAALAPLSAARATTPPHALLAAACEALELRATLVNRHPRSAERALANLDRFLRAAKAYESRGLQAYADATWRAWLDTETAPEGQVDAVEDAVTLITMHSAKGLEWRVVIPVGSMAGPARWQEPWYSRHSGRPVMSLLGHAGSDADALQEAERADRRAERLRLWYVTATRARDLLVVPTFAFDAATDAWCDLVPWQEVVPWRTVTATEAPTRAAASGPSDRGPTRDEFEAQSAAVARAVRHVERRAPSRRDEPPAASAAATDAPAPPALTPELGEWVLSTLDADDDALPTDRPAAGTTRGVLLHKLMEEIVEGDTAPTPPDLTRRAEELLAALATDDPGVAPADVAAMAHRAWHAPEVRALSGRLWAEVPVAGVERDPATGAEVVWSGVADAVAIDAAGHPEAVIDWKSDRAPTEPTLAHYREQVRAYLRLTGAPLGLVVLAASGEVLRVTAH